MSELEETLRALCRERYEDKNTGGDVVEEDYRRLCNEPMRVLLAGELSVFVTTAGVDGNNNASERQLRDDATARKTGRTSKTTHGAKRRSIISSVLQSVCKQLDCYTLAGVIAEVKSWMYRGRSCFQDEAEASQLSQPERPNSLLDQLILSADATLIPTSTPFRVIHKRFITINGVGHNDAPTEAFAVDVDRFFEQL